MAFIIFFVALLAVTIAQFVFITRLKLEIIRNKQNLPEYEAKDIYNIWKLLRLHKSFFPLSRTRCFYFVSLGFWLLLILPFITALLADRFLHTNLLHLIHVGR